MGAKKRRSVGHPRKSENIFKIMYKHSHSIFAHVPVYISTSLNEFVYPRLMIISIVSPFFQFFVGKLWGVPDGPEIG